MNLYKISQEVNNAYDTYNSAVVAAKTEEFAKKIHPSNTSFEVGESEDHDWCGVGDVKVELIGKAVKGVKQGVIVSSYNAG